MKTFLTIMLILHIISGTTALICGLISMIAKKGGKVHNISGRIFFWAMTGVFITATSIGWIKSLWFLFFVGFFSYYLACSGYRSLYLKKLHMGQKAQLLDWFISFCGLSFGLALVAMAVYIKLNGASLGSSSVPAMFGGLSIYFSVKDIQKFFKRPTEKTHWIVSHGSKMGGAFIATVTAFTVVNVKVGHWGWTLWILPTVIITPILTRMIKKFVGGKKKKAGFNDVRVVL